MKYLNIVLLSLLLPSLVFGANVDTQNKQKLNSLLEQKYGADIMKQINAINTAEHKIQNIHSDKITRLKNLLKETKNSIILKNMYAYIAKKYINSGEYKKEEFLPAYKELIQVDSKADIHIYYAQNLRIRLQNAIPLNESSQEFRGLIYILFVLKENSELYPSYEENLIQYWEQNWQEIKNSTDTKIPLSKRPLYEKTLGTVAKKEDINIYSLDDLAMMHNIIEQERISPNSLYFKAYIALRERLLKLNGKILLSAYFSHGLQTKKLSCEANSATDLINFYRLQSDLMAIDEGDIIDRLPVSRDEIIRTNNNLVWGDPNEYFVGSMDGKQSSNIRIFTGYGIYANGILPTINHFLGLQNLTAKRNIFDEKHILDSLSKGHPVMFWYLSPVSENKDGKMKYSSKSINWKTPGGKDIRGYIGEHTGVIVGGEFDRSGHMTQVYYYQGRNMELEQKDFESLKEEASYFNEVIYVENK